MPILQYHSPTEQLKSLVASQVDPADCHGIHFACNYGHYVDSVSTNINHQGSLGLVPSDTAI